MRISRKCRPNYEEIPSRALQPPRPDPALAEEVRRGLLQPPRSLPPKYFYDAHGSELFEEICATPEYYLTRTEASLLMRCAGEIITTARPAHIIELGSGSSKKTRHLFDACERARHCCTYWALDVCEEALIESRQRLCVDYRWLAVTALAGDYSSGLSRLPLPSGTRMYVFLGSSIGNFDEGATETFLQQLRASMVEGDWLLLGADRVKDPAVLEAAYNDAAGITARFNLNILRVLNRELKADFELSAYVHEAGYNAQQERIEMHLVSRAEQRVRLARLDLEITLECGEKILTEISRKYSYRGIVRMLAKHDLQVVRHYQPEDQSFSLVLARKAYAVDGPL